MKIMILGANTLQLPLIQQAKRDGHIVIVVSPVKEEPGFKYADIPAYIDLRDQDAILKFAIEHDIDGVITDQTDIPVRTAAYVAEKMGLPGISYETACLFTDKFKMRERCKELGIQTLKYRLVHNIEEALEFWENIGCNVILKPVDNQGSRGVSKVTSKKELLEKFDEAVAYSRSGQVLIEQFVEGIEFVVEGMAFNYEFQNLVCGDTYYFDIPDVFSATTRTFPSDRKAILVEKVKELNKKIITGFGLKQGISHSEFIVSDDEVYLIETAARGGGVFISSDLISLSTGLNTEQFLIRTALGIQSDLEKIKNTGAACGYMAFFLPVGEVISLDGVTDVVNLPYTHRNNFETLYIGKKTKPYTDKTARYFTIVSADTIEVLKERMEHIRKLLQVKVKNENGILGPIWN